MTSIKEIASSLGASEPALRLILTIFAGYPLTLIYNTVISKLSLRLINTYFATTGALLYYFNYGTDIYHSFITILITYGLCMQFKNSKALYLISFTFNMGYLLVGYYYTESNEYDILWTMPHCVLALRLIGFSFDVADGHQIKSEDLSKEQKYSALDSVPSLLEFLGYTYFPSSFIVGPQFPFRRYSQFIQGNFYYYYSTKLTAGLERAGLGVLYLVIRQIGSYYIPDNYLLTDEFTLMPFYKKLFIISIWGKLTLYKYVSCWLLTEGSLILYGITYNGKTAKGEDDWSGCSNIKLKLFETLTSMEQYIHCFNVNTNQWLGQYVYKRLKFLNNRDISYASALIFLATWHGFHSGYYMAFFLEYLIVTMEKQYNSAWNKLIVPKYSEQLNKPVMNYGKLALLKLYTLLCMGYCMIPFCYMDYNVWLKVYSSINFYGYIQLGLWFILYFSYILPTTKRIPRNAEENQSPTKSATD